ncbi:MAG: DUF2779 domain-containing protein [Dehalococcoidia bacterium]
MIEKLPLLSKSRFMAGLQCHKRLYLMLFQPELADEIGEAKQAIFDAGAEVGVLARGIFPGGVLLDQDYMHHKEAMAQTVELLKDKKIPALYEAAFMHDDVRIRADILVRAGRGMFDLVEVKSGNSVKPEHIPDAAVQVWVLEGCGIRVRKACLAHLNKEYIYPGGEYDLQELFVVEDVTDDVREFLPDVPEMLAEMRAALALSEPPDIAPGKHCSKPYDCEFCGHCFRVFPEHYVGQLPGAREKLLRVLAEAGVDDIRNIPNDFIGLNPLQQRVRDCVVDGCVFMGPELSGQLAGIQYPVYFLDFETFNPALPLYVGTRPYQVLPIQWSCHIMDKKGKLSHEEFLHDGSDDPREPFAESLIDVLNDSGSIVVYSSFEASQIKGLIRDLPHLSYELSAVLNGRIVDLLKIIKANCYHPDFHGSFSIKAVLPALVPGLGYGDLEIQEGSMASLAYSEMIKPETSAKRRREIRKNLLAYCGRDTEAMVRLFQILDETRR